MVPLKKKKNNTFEGCVFSSPLPYYLGDISKRSKIVKFIKRYNKIGRGIYMGSKKKNDLINFRQGVSQNIIGNL